MPSEKSKQMKSIQGPHLETFHDSKEPYVNEARDVEKLQSKKARKKSRRPHLKETK